MDLGSDPQLKVRRRFDQRKNITAQEVTPRTHVASVPSKLLPLSRCFQHHGELLLKSSPFIPLSFHPNPVQLQSGHVNSPSLTNNIYTYSQFGVQSTRSCVFGLNVNNLQAYSISTPFSATWGFNCPIATSVGVFPLHGAQTQQGFLHVRPFLTFLTIKKYGQHLPLGSNS